MIDLQQYIIKTTFTNSSRERFIIMRSAVQSCVPLQESTAKSCVFFRLYTSGLPEGSGHWHLWSWKLAFKATEMAMDSQGAKRPVAWRSRNQKHHRVPLRSFLGYYANRHEGLEGAHRATETSCVPLLENQALTKLSWVLFRSWEHWGNTR